jgi:hypothetical protein
MSLPQGFFFFQSHNVVCTDLLPSFGLGVPSFSSLLVKAEGGGPPIHLLSLLLLASLLLLTFLLMLASLLLLMYLLLLASPLLLASLIANAGVPAISGARATIYSNGNSFLCFGLVMSTIPKRKYKRSDIEANCWNETKTF